jgi:hypothetical protein
MSFANTSILINRQVPEFVRDEYPLFITFLEAYYEFLEQKQAGEKNDLTQQAKNLRYLSDVDASINEFESSFFNSYASLLPRDAEVNKEFLIKNVLPIYLSKGNEAAFKLLFRMLFNDEIQVSFPKNNVLRASDGKWVIDNILRVQTNIRSVYTGDGTTKEFILAQQVTAEDIIVEIDGTTKTNATDFFIRKEARKIVFNTAPSSGAVIKVFYEDFLVTNLANRKITGTLSGATALVERASKRIITDLFNFGFPFELVIDNKTLIGDFISGEKITTDILDSNGNLIEIEADGFSTLQTITIINGGTSYNIGDIVPINGGGYRTQGSAIIDRVSDGSPTTIQVVYGGAGFQIGSNVQSTTTTTVTGYVDLVDTSGANSASFYNVTDDVIGNYASVLVSAADYGFPRAGSENVNTRICDALSPLIVSGIGPTTNAIIVFAGPSTSNSIPLNAQSATFIANNDFFEIKSFGSIGRIDVSSGGTGYKIGDEVIFGANPLGTIGLGAAATVSNVSVTGAVTKIQIEPPRIGGTANVLNNTVEIVGTSTDFGTEVIVGDKIVIRGQERFINAITSSTQANVNVAFTFTDGTIYANDCSVGSFSSGQVGGTNYTQGQFPTVSVSNVSGGSGANIAITSLMGDGEILNAISAFVAGQILSIKITNAGTGYQYNPLVDLTDLGDGLAVAEAAISNSYVTLAGRWTTSDSIISSSERKLQGANYYVDYSYITSSLTEFGRYKEILKGLLHPAGFVNYALLNRDVDTVTNTQITSVTTGNTISGTVNVATGTIYITGSNTKFNIADTRSILTIGSNVAVNGEIRTISSIISNTNAAVSSAFTQTANDQTLIIVT